MHITALNNIINEEKYNKNVKKSRKKIDKLEAENQRSTMEDDIFLSDPDLWDVGNKSDSFFKQAERIRNLRYKGIKLFMQLILLMIFLRLPKIRFFEKKMESDLKLLAV